MSEFLKMCIYIFFVQRNQNNVDCPAGNNCMGRGLPQRNSRADFGAEYVIYCWVCTGRKSFGGNSLATMMPIIQEDNTVTMTVTDWRATTYRLNV